MRLSNTTRNQHYISQAEQRLNAINPNARKANQSMYAFDVVAREPDVVLGPSRTVKICRTLSFDDLFTFDAQDRVTRSNLEAAFARYEADVTRHSASLLGKLEAHQPESAKTEIVNLFAAKLLNFLRNPYAVEKVLNSVGAAANARPADAALEEAYRRVLTGSKPQKQWVCASFNISPELYDRWLRALFMLLMVHPPSEVNMFDGVVRSLFETKHVAVKVHHYPGNSETQVCLLSDRGFNVPQSDDAIFAFEFNISSRAYGQFVFADVPSVAGVPVPEEVLARLNGRVVVDYVRGDANELARYNCRTAYQSAGTVFAGGNAPLVRCGSGS